MSDALPLGPGREFDVLRRVFARIGPAATGLGDDCALVQVGNAVLAASIDCSVEGTHFRTDWFSHEEIGWRAAAAALSDRAAEGAAPLGVLVSLGVPGGGDPASTAAAIMGGVADAALAVGAKVLGGDLVRSEKIVLDVCALGTADRPVRRRGARVGDGLWVTGQLGASRLALRALQTGQKPADEHRRRFAHPEPRVSAGRWLAKHDASAMIDLSDGLAADARHLAAASGVALAIQLERVPCVLGADALTAVASGEEYELLVALPPSFGPSQANTFQEFHDLPLTKIGSVQSGEGVRFTDRGGPVSPAAGWDHFA